MPNLRGGAMELETNQWLWGILGAILIGLGKGGLPGVGNLTVAIYANVFEPRASVGILLPVLLSADLVAVTVYRRHAEWSYLRRLLPWMAVGIVVGYGTLGVLPAGALKPLIGGILLGMTALHFTRLWLVRRHPGGSLEQVPHTLPFRAGTGILGGFATLVANAAGPVASLYFLAVGLPKLAFIGTGAWTFLFVNLFKVPFLVDLGMITGGSLGLSFAFMPFAMGAAAVAPRLVRFLPQKTFEILIWVFVVIGGLKLLY